MGKRKTRHVDEAAVRRSLRNNAGQGGVTQQLAQLDVVLESPTKVAKRGRVSVPDTEPVNSFAPKETVVNLKSSNRRKVSIPYLLCINAVLTAMVEGSPPDPRII